MKKIIWIFGEEGTGKTTLLKNAQDTMDNIDIVYNDLDRIKCIEEFMKNDKDILFIKGISNDYKKNHGDILKQISINYPSLSKDIYILELNNIDKHYLRLINKEWFKNNIAYYSTIFTKETLQNSVDKLRNILINYVDYNYNIYLIDSTKGFKIIGKYNKNKELIKM